MESPPQKYKQIPLKNLPRYSKASPKPKSLLILPAFIHLSQGQRYICYMGRLFSPFGPWIIQIIHPQLACKWLASGTTQGHSPGPMNLYGAIRHPVRNPSCATCEPLAATCKPLASQIFRIIQIIRIILDNPDFLARKWLASGCKWLASGLQAAGVGRPVARKRLASGYAQMDRS